MKNKEFYLDEIIDLISHGCKVAVKDNAPSACQVSCECDECLFYGRTGVAGYWKCNIEKFKEWANEEHVEYVVDWEKVPIDTPIYVWDDGDERKTKAHFARAEEDEEDDFILCIYAWDGGGTSFTRDNCGIKTTGWDHAELAEPHPEWMKKKGE